MGLPGKLFIVSSETRMPVGVVVSTNCNDNSITTTGDNRLMFWLGYSTCIRRCVPRRSTAA